MRRKDEDATNAEHLGKLLRQAKGQVRRGVCLTHNGAKRRKWFKETVIV